MKIKEGIEWVGVLNPTLRKFDVIMCTEYGTTYNAYLVKDEKVALIDASHGGFEDLFIEKLSAAIDPKRIDYIVVQHTEPDHSGSICKLLDLCPNAQVVSTKTAAKWLGQITNRSFNSHTIEDGEEISLGKKTLKFMVTPFWHWPDTMFTYVPEDGVLFSCDGFGAHFCDERMYDDLVDRELYEDQFLSYYDVIMRPFADKIYDGVQKVKELDLEMICPSHGPIIREDPYGTIDLYEQWSDAQRNPSPKLAVFYASAYGNTRAMAESIAEGALEHIDVALLDVATASGSELRESLEQSTAIAVGSCTINGDALEPIWSLLSLYALVPRRGKTGCAFGSYGWSGEAVGQIEDRMRGLKLKVVESGLRINFVPTEDDLEKCRAFGAEYAKQVTEH